MTKTPLTTKSASGPAYKQESGRCGGGGGSGDEKKRGCGMRDAENAGEERGEKKKTKGGLFDHALSGGVRVTDN